MDNVDNVDNMDNVDNVDNMDNVDNVDNMDVPPDDNADPQASPIGNQPQEAPSASRTLVRQGFLPDVRAVLSRLATNRRWRYLGLLVLGGLVVAIISGSIGYGLGYQRGRFAVLAPTKGRSATTLAAPATLTRTFSDSLQAGNIYGWAEDSTHCRFDRDGYHVTYAICSPPLSEQQDEVVSVQVSQVSGSPTTHYGMAVHWTWRGSDHNYVAYEFVITSSGTWLLRKREEEAYTDIIAPTQSATLHTGLHTANVLAMRVVGTRFDFALNGVEVAHVTDTSYPSGQIGLATDATGEAVFTNFSIKY